MKKHKNLIWGGVILLILLLNNFFSFFDNFFKEASVIVLKPVATFFSGTAYGIRKKFSFLGEIGNLKEENQKLVEENLYLQGELARLSDVEKENEIFRKELKLPSREGYNLEAALIIGRSSGDYQRIIHINKGEKDGIKEGMAVLAKKRILIGRVIDVGRAMSKVRLLVDRSFKVNAKITECDTRGIVEGRFGTAVIMKMIPQDVELKVGEKVVTSELSNNFPEGVLIGYLQEISRTPDKLFQEVSISLPVDFDNLHLVWVLKR